MSRKPTNPSLHHLELLALSREQARQRRLLNLTSASVATAAFMCVALLARNPLAWPIAIAWLAVTGAGWAWHAKKAWGDDGAFVRAWRRWLRAMAWTEAAKELATMFFNLYPASTRAQAGEVLLTYEELAAYAFAPPNDADRSIADALALHLRHWLIQRDADLARAREEAAQIVADAWAMRERIVGETLDDADDVRAGRPPRHASWQRPSDEARGALLRELFEQAVRDAERGVVRESEAATAVLKNPGRWRRGATSQSVTEALSDLFDPTPPVPPPRPRK